DDSRGFEWGYLWRLSRGNYRTALKQTNGRITAAAFAPDGKLLASPGADSTVRFWDPVRGREVHALPPPYRAEASKTADLPSGILDLSRVTFSPDGKWLAALGQDSVLVLWRKGERGEEWKAVATHRADPGTITALAFTPVSGQLVAGYGNGD